mgnify:FL=1
MDLRLSEAQADVRARARRVAREVIAPRAALHDREARFPREQMQALADEGFLAMLAPTAVGGGGHGSIAYSLAMTEVARACAATAVTMAVTNMVADAICAWGSEEQKALHVPKLASGAYVAGSFCLSEPDAGSDAASLRTRRCLMKRRG